MAPTARSSCGPSDPHHVRGLLGPAGRDRGGVAQLVVPHRRHRPDRRRRLPLLRRSQGRLPPAPRENISSFEVERIVVQHPALADVAARCRPSSPRTTSRSPRPSAKARRWPRRSCSAGASTSSRTSPSALHRAAPSCPGHRCGPGPQARPARGGDHRRLVGRRGVGHHLRQALSPSGRRRGPAGPCSSSTGPRCPSSWPRCRAAPCPALRALVRAEPAAATRGDVLGRRAAHPWPHRSEPVPC